MLLERPVSSKLQARRPFCVLDKGDPQAEFLEWKKEQCPQ